MTCTYWLLLYYYYTTTNTTVLLILKTRFEKVYKTPRAAWSACLFASPLLLGEKMGHWSPAFTPLPPPLFQYPGVGYPPPPTWWETSSNYLCQEGVWFGFGICAHMYVFGKSILTFLLHSKTNDLLSLKILFYYLKKQWSHRMFIVIFRRRFISSFWIQYTYIHIS